MGESARGCADQCQLVCGDRGSDGVGVVFEAVENLLERTRIGSERDVDTCERDGRSDDWAPPNVPPRGERRQRSGDGEVPPVGWFAHWGSRCGVDPCARETDEELGLRPDGIPQQGKRPPSGARCTDLLAAISADQRQIVIEALTLLVEAARDHDDQQH